MTASSMSLGADVASSPARSDAAASHGFLLQAGCSHDQLSARHRHDRVRHQRHRRDHRLLHRRLRLGNVTALDRINRAIRVRDDVCSLYPSHVTAGRVVSSQVLETDSGLGKVMVMRVFVAGGTGVVGRRLVPQLVARGHQVTATTTGPGKLGMLEQLGADAVVMDGLDAVSVGEAVAAARPDVIVHQMTAIGARRQARYEAHGSVVRHHQPAAHRGDRSPARRGRGDRRIPRRRAGLRQLERNPPGRMGEDRGGPAGPARGDGGARR